MSAAQLQRQDEVKARRVIKQRYELQAQLGKGNFGKVYLAIDNHDIGRKVAVKVVDTRAFRSKDQQQHANNEKAICEKLSQTLEHKNIVKVYDVFLEYDKIYVVMEYVEGGELFEEIKRRRRLTEPVARRYFREIIEAVAFIHENKIVHRDLKPENVLLDKQQSIRLCDFGFGKFCERHKTLETYCGSPFYAAPEMVTATPYLGPPVDMWSCGVILYAMLAGSLPFQGEDMQHLFRRIDEAKFELPPNISQEAADLIKRLLCRIPSARITARDCLAHPWLAEPVIEPSPNPSVIAVTTVSDGRVPEKQAISSSSSPSSATSSLSVHKKSRASRLLTRMFAKKTQVAPAATATAATSSSSPQQSPKKRNKIKAVESKMASRVKGFLKSTFQRRIA